MKILFAQTNYPPFLQEFYRSNGNWENKKYHDVMQLWAAEWFGTANFYSTNLKKYNVQAKEIIMNDWNSQSLWASENNVVVTQQKIPFSDFIPELIKNTFGLREWIKKITFAQVDDYRPDVLYLHDLSIMNSSDLRNLRKKVKLVVGQIACPLPLNKEPLKHYDLIISSFPHYVKDFRKQNIHSEYLRWCVEDSIQKKVGVKKKVYEVVYVGGLTASHKLGNNTLEQLARNVPVDVWGYGEGNLSRKSPILKSFHGQAWGKKMYEIFAQSKIVINRHIDVSKQYANNMRLFEATAMGALLITDHKVNIGEFFKVGKEVVTYKSPDDLIEKVLYYIQHEDEAKRIALAGQARTLADHTYKNRMKELKGIIEKYL